MELAWARVPLAWARPISLSEELGEGAWLFVASLFLDSWHLLEFNCYVKSMGWMIMHEWYGSWIMNDRFSIILACDLNGMVGYQSGMVSVWNTLLYSWIRKDKLEWIQRGIWMKIDYRGWHEIYIHDKYYLVGWIWLVCGQDVISWASRWDIMVVLQWSGRNSMTPVSGSSWWCPIFII